MMERIFIIGTGLIGASTGLALRAAGFAGRIDGWDTSQLEMAAAVQMGAIDGRAASREDALELARLANVVVLAVPVLAIKDWMQAAGTGNAHGPTCDGCGEHEARDCGACAATIF